MFNPVSDDFFNEESTVSDYRQIDNVIEIHPTIIKKSPDVSPEMSPDVTRQNQITVADFCQLHSITSDQFLALRRKASRKFPEIDFKPTREGSRTFWVKNVTILTQMIDEGSIKPKSAAIETDEVIDGEIVETQPLSDGSALVIRKQSFELSLPPLNAPMEREFISIDVSPIERLTASLKAEQQAKAEMEEAIALRSHAEKVSQQKAQFDLIEMLIKQGYTADQSVTIARGANQA